MTTHYMEEAEVADRIALIDAGRIIAQDTPKQLQSLVGGGVILLTTEDDVRAAVWLREQGYTPETSERGLLLINNQPATLLPALLGAMPVKTLRAEVHEPSLEGVFLKLTGRGLDSSLGQAPETFPGNPR